MLTNYITGNTGATSVKLLRSVFQPGVNRLGGDFRICLSIRRGGLRSLLRKEGL